ncbi:protein of unknown function [Pseudomonas sp. JV551A1]|uniref:Uncharacterized protein n=1 Tax=Pseudomonas inefficax TaxID=2078786 RepID=A0AAQ1P435_9PSED|nr:protein of unknown function [Pseudomonas sp. JV551A1]SPO58858.1 protein of unknown function [Pseudomonas inefficax]
MGAGVPANTGAARAIHRVSFFAGLPAPTESGAVLESSVLPVRHKTML